MKDKLPEAALDAIKQAFCDAYEQVRVRESADEIVQAVNERLDALLAYHGFPEGVLKCELADIDFARGIVIVRTACPVHHVTYQLKSNYPPEE